MRIGIIGVSHETNTFAVERNDTMACVHLRRGSELLSGAHPKSFIGGFAEGAQRHDVELVPGVGIGFAHGGIIGREVYEECRGEVVDSLAGHVAHLIRERADDVIGTYLRSGVNGLERWQEEGRITASDAEKTRQYLAGGEVHSGLRHLGAHLAITLKAVHH